MARYTGPSCKLCRREGKKLFLKGDRCLTDKCAVARRTTVPGQHGAGRKNVKEYGLQLREKQTARRYYGVQEKQFKSNNVKADKKAGVTGENLLTILECRLDNIVYRAGFANSRKEARQLVLHRHFTVNGKKVNIPSYLCKAGDVIAVADNFKNSEKLKAIIEANGARPVPMWIDKNNDQMVASIVRLPNREDIDLEVEEHLIVELYSK